MGGRLLFVAVVALGRTVHSFMAVLAGSAVSRTFVDGDLGRFTLVTFCAVAQFLSMGLVVKGHIAF